MRTLAIWCLVMAIARIVGTEEASEEKSRQYLFDTIPTRPTPLGWQHPTTARPSLLGDWRKTLLSWLPDWLTNAEPSVLYPGVQFPEPPRVPEVPYFFRRPTYAPQQYYPRPYQGGPHVQGYRPGPQLPPVGYRPSQQLPPAAYGPQVPLYGYRPGPQRPIYQPPPTLYGQVGQLPYSGETAPYPSYNPSGLGAASAPRPVYQGSASQANAPGRAPEKPGNEEGTKQNVEIHPVYKGPTTQVKTPEVPTSDDKTLVQSAEGQQTSQLEQQAAEYMTNSAQLSHEHRQPAPIYVANPSQQAPIYVANPSQQAPIYVANPSQQAPVYVANPSQQAPVYVANPSQQAPIYVVNPSQQDQIYVVNPSQANPSQQDPVYVVNPAQANPSQPAQEYMANPSQANPSQPAQEYMANPSRANPSQPAQEYMANPSRANPSQPAPEYIANPSLPIQEQWQPAPDFMVNYDQPAPSPSLDDMDQQSKRHHGPPHETNSMKFIPSQKLEPDPTGEAIKVVPAPDLSKAQRVLTNRP